MTNNFMTTDRTSNPTVGGGEIHRARAAGFTVLELLITIAIASILLTLAVPSFQYVTNSNRISAELNGLVGDLQYARAEAIREGRTVTVCTSTNGTSCSNLTTWQSGWIVIDTNATIFHVQPTFSSTDTFVASNNVSTIAFNRDGYAVGIPNGTLITLHDATDTHAWTRCLSINLSGEMTTELYDTTTNGVTCT